MRLKAAFWVQAGVIIGHPLPEYNRSWPYTDVDFEADMALPPMPDGHKLDPNGPLDQPHMSRFTRMQFEAQRYYSSLINPLCLNWAELKWMLY